MTSIIPAAEVSQVVAIIQSLQTDGYCAVAALAWLVFEWSLTLSREVELYWKDRLSAAKVLFFWNRYLPIITLCVGFYGTSRYSDQRCTTQIDVEGVLDYLQYVPWACFAAMRAYALGGRRWYLAAVTLLFSSMPFILNWFHLVFNKYAYDPDLTCISVEVVPPTINLALTIVSRSSLIIADALVVAVTWHTTYSTVRLEALDEKYNSFSRLLLVNGTVYFATLCTLNALQLAFTLCTIAINSILDGDSSYFVEFIEPITAILVNRFLLQLQEVKRRNEGERSLGEMSSYNFDRVIGCLSSKLEPEDVWAGGEVPGEELREDPS